MYEGTNFIEETSVVASSSEPEGHEYRHESSLEQHDFSATPRQLSHTGAEQGRAESLNSVDAFMAHDPWKVEVMRLVTTTYEGTQHQALLLTKDTLQKLQAIAQNRRELQALESEIETTIDSHVKAGLEIEVQIERPMPGAFPQDDDDSKTESTCQGLLLAFKKKPRASGPAIEKLKAERSILLAELERLQELVLNGIVRVVEEGRAE